ncbi:MAG: hypothetical protein IJI60_01665 [Bacilli bacterium]|nr:hypothetical protein [Bacilli bacterium]
MKKRTKILIIIIVIILLILLLSAIIFLSMNARDSKEKDTKPEYKEAMTITCIKEVGHDEVKQTETVYMENGILITRRTSAVWTKAEPKERTCEYYTDQTNGLNTKKGVNASVTCDEQTGNASAVYMISEIDREDMKLKQFDYMNEKGIFDYKGWTDYMETSGYTCEEE